MAKPVERRRKLRLSKTEIEVIHLVLRMVTKREGQQLLKNSIQRGHGLANGVHADLYIYPVLVMIRYP